jgi:uncharacterized protein YjbI with pentapeptide repeats
MQSDLSDANLYGAHIDRADLTRTRFNRANLKEADFSGTDTSTALFDDARGAPH